MMNIYNKSDYCGYHSGHEADKFKETGLTPKPARKVRAPIIEERVAHMECKVVQQFETGDRNLSIGEVIEAYSDKMVVQGDKKNLLQAVFHPKSVV